jgi:hypothetical protein
MKRSSKDARGVRSERPWRSGVVERSVARQDQFGVECTEIIEACSGSSRVGSVWKTHGMSCGVLSRWLSTTRVTRASPVSSVLLCGRQEHVWPIVWPGEHPTFGLLGTSTTSSAHVTTDLSCGACVAPTLRSQVRKLHVPSFQRGHCECFNSWPISSPVAIGPSISLTWTWAPVALASAATLMGSVWAWVKMIASTSSSFMPIEARPCSSLGNSLEHPSSATVVGFVHFRLSMCIGLSRPTLWIDRRGWGRPRQFDVHAVLDALVQLFWDRGFEAVSLNDIVATAKLNRSSLYTTFGTKDQMFFAAVDRYLADRSATLDEALGGKGVSRTSANFSRRCEPGSPPTAAAEVASRSTR